MNLWDKLFTTQISEPPQFELHWYIGLLCLLALTFYASYRFDKVAYQRFIQILQSVQLIVLYSWYWGNLMPLSEKFALLSLPYRHVCDALDSRDIQVQTILCPFRNF